MTSNPGSRAAVAEGCICPAILNRQGLGTPHGNPLFYYDTGCPVHRRKAQDSSEDAEPRPGSWQAR